MSVTMTYDAVNEITRRIAPARTLAHAESKTIPLLIWAQDSFEEDRAGNRTDLGPQFFLSWTNAAEIDDNQYLLINEGINIALAPGDFFRSGSHRITRSRGRLTLGCLD